MPIDQDDGRTAAPDVHAAADSPLVAMLRVRAVPFIALAISTFFFNSALGLQFGTLANPGPGLWPVVVSIVAVTASTVLLFKGSGWTREANGTVWLPPLTILVLFSAAWALERFGFLVVTTTLAFFVTRIVGRASWAMTIPTVVLVPTSTYYLFSSLLGVPLP